MRLFILSFLSLLFVADSNPLTAGPIPRWLSPPNVVAPTPGGQSASAVPSGFVVLSENFDELTPLFGATWAGVFATVNGTNVDIYTPLGYGNPCLAPESGNCIDLNGTPNAGPNGNPQGQLQSAYVFPPGDYLLSFNLVGSQRNTVASATVTMGNYSHTFTLQPQDFTSGVVENVPVTVTNPTPLTFTGDPNNISIGLFLDNVVVRTTGIPLVVSPPSTRPCKGGLHYSSISAAVAAASPGAFVYVCAGTYQEQVVIEKPVSIVGVTTGGNGQAADYPVLLTPNGGLHPSKLASGSTLYPISTYSLQGKPIAAQLAVVGTTGVQISGLEIDGRQNDTGQFDAQRGGLYIQNASGEISGNIILNQTIPSGPATDSGFAILAESGTPVAAQGGAAGTTTMAILSNTLTDFQLIGIGASGASTNAGVVGNHLSLSAAKNNAHPNGIVFVNAAGAVAGNSIQNLTSGSVSPSIGIDLVGTNNITVQANTVANVDSPVVISNNASVPTAADPDGNSDQTTVTNNTLSGSGFSGSDGINVCSNSNTISSNAISNVANAGIHLSTMCPEGAGTADPTSGNSNYVAYNTISQTCAGVAVGGNNNNVSFNSVSNAYYAFWLGDICGSPNATAPSGNSNLLNTLSSPKTPAANSDCMYIMGAGTSSYSLALQNSTTISSACNIYINSTSNSLWNGSGSSISATGGSSIKIQGGSSGAWLYGTTSPTPAFGSPSESDPLAYVTAPTFSSCTSTNTYVNGTVATLNPGTYCNLVINNSTVTLNPGLYILVGGSSWMSGSTITGTGVTLYLTRGGSYTSYSNFNIFNSVVNLSAPTSSASGGITGVIVFADRNWVSPGNDGIFLNTANLVTDGVWYAPNVGIWSNASTLQGTNYLGIVTDNMYLSGTMITIPSPNYSSLAGGSPYK